MNLFVNRALVVLAGSLASAFIITMAHAAERGPAQAEDGPPSSMKAVGVLAAAARPVYRDADTEGALLPLFIYENRVIAFAGNQLDVKVPLEGAVSWRLRTRYDFNGYEAKDSPYLEGMARRKGSVWVGAAFAWEADGLALSGELLGDASGKSKGRQWRLQAEHAWRFGRTEVVPRVAVVGHDDKFVDYYYGVTAAEQRAGRAAYRGRSATDVELGLRVSYQLSEQHGVFVDADATRLGKGAKESPLVEHATRSGLRVGYIYRY